MKAKPKSLRTPDTRQPVLIVLHQETSSPGRVGQMLVKKGYRLDIRRPPLGDPLPETLRHHSGAVVFGGPMSANDDHLDYIRREIDWHEVPLKENKPYLGICLGAQMLVRHLGGQVRSAPGNLTEIGWYALHATDYGRSLMHWPQMVYHFHREGFDLPHGLRLLATGDAYRNQAYRYGANAWGIQFHAELTRAMMQKWVVRGAHRFVLPNAQPGRAHLHGRLIHDAPLRAWLSGFLDLIFDKTAPAAVEEIKKPSQRDRQEALSNALSDPAE